VRQPAGGETPVFDSAGSSLIAPTKQRLVSCLSQDQPGVVFTVGSPAEADASSVLPILRSYEDRLLAS
jgi:hypothetical protein